MMQNGKGRIAGTRDIMLLLAQVAGVVQAGRVRRQDLMVEMLPELSEEDERALDRANDRVGRGEA